MFVKHFIKTLHVFGHNCLTIFRKPSSVLSAVTTSLLVCAVKLFIWYVAVCCLCVCVPDVLVCGMFGCELFTAHNQTSHRQVHQVRTHIDNIQPHTKHPTNKYIRHAHTQTTYSHIPNIPQTSTSGTHTHRQHT